MDNEETAVAAGCINVDKSGCTRIWIPPTGRPYWVIAGRHTNAGPDLTDLTDEELVKYGLRGV